MFSEVSLQDCMISGLKASVKLLNLQCNQGGPQA